MLPASIKYVLRLLSSPGMTASTPASAVTSAIKTNPVRIRCQNGVLTNSRMTRMMLTTSSRIEYEPLTQYAQPCIEIRVVDMETLPWMDSPSRNQRREESAQRINSITTG